MPQWYTVRSWLCEDDRGVITRSNPWPGQAEGLKYVAKWMRDNKTTSIVLCKATTKRTKTTTFRRNGNAWVSDQTNIKKGKPLYFSPPILWSPERKGETPCTKRNKRSAPIGRVGASIGRTS